jgi:hypothetical protein
MPDGPFEASAFQPDEGGAADNSHWIVDDSNVRMAYTHFSLACMPDGPFTLSQAKSHAGRPVYLIVG